MDAFDPRENRFVAVKRVRASQNKEREIYIALANLRDDPRNHCVPVLESIPIPGKTDEYLAVMPLLRDRDFPLFEYVEQCVDFLGQLLEVRSLIRN
jgi:hypothetical protein